MKRPHREHALRRRDHEGQRARVGEQLLYRDPSGVQHLARAHAQVGAVLEADADAADEREAVAAAQLEQVLAQPTSERADAIEDGRGLGALRP